jgi:hypothetical protein
VPVDELEMRRQLVGWWLQGIVNGAVPPVVGGELIRSQAWLQLDRPDWLSLMLESVDRYSDWAANQIATPAQLAADIVAAARQVLAAADIADLT